MPLEPTLYESQRGESVPGVDRPQYGPVEAQDQNQVRRATTDWFMFFA